VNFPLYHDQSKYADWGWIRDQDHNIVANVIVPFLTDEAKCRAEQTNPCKERVEFIVRACNCHDELLEALEIMIAAFGLPDSKAAKIGEEKARAAIARATGKESA